MIKQLIAFGTLLLCPLSAWCGHSLTPLEQRIVEDWLAKHPAYRIATDADCTCPDDIRQMRAGYGGDWGPIPDYHPYVATGDFNSDGINEFAIVVMDRTKLSKNFTFLVFNGPFGSKSAAAAFVKSGADLRYEGLQFGPPRSKPYLLGVGRFESDNTATLVPRGRTYVPQ